MSNFGIDFLIGEKINLENTLKPFCNEIVNFLNEFSKKIEIKKNIREYPEIKSLAFFCRKKNILNFKEKFYDKDRIRFGLGIVFHVTPSNIPTNFMYSLIFGLLSGNSNIVKVPSRKFEEINIICDVIEYLFKKKRHFKVKKMVKIVRYNSEDISLTKKFSKISDARLIWGGDQTIEEIRKIETKARTIDVPFADRYSISIINSDKLIKLPNYKFKILIKNFFNDTYQVDQNACSSPHIIYWQGKNIKDAKKKFWKNLNLLVEENYSPPLISSIDNYCRLSKELLKNFNLSSYKIYSKSLYVIKLKKIKNKSFIEKSKWGFFYESDIKNLKEIQYLVNKNYKQ